MRAVVRVAFGCDHAGFVLRRAILGRLAKMGVHALDFGCKSGQEPVDYPDYAGRVARAVSRGKADLGLLCCGTGIGMSIAANKIPGARAAVVWDAASARLAREHNAANVLCLGGRMLTPKKAMAAVTACLRSKPSSEPRHRRRLAKIRKLEKK